MKVSSGDFNYLLYRNISTREAREIRLDDTPAVYAWYRSLKFGDSVTSQDKFVEHLETIISAKLSDKFTSHVGPIYSVSVQEKPFQFSGRKMEVLKQLSSSSTGREYLESLLVASTFLQAPLYVGKTTKLQTRIGEHVSGKSGLLKRFEDAGIVPSQCILRYRYFSSSELEIVKSLVGCSEDLFVTLIEELISKLSPAAFVRRHG